MDAQEMKAFFEKQMTYENVNVPPGEMSPRQRFMAIMDYQKPDRMIDTEFGYWDDTLRRWHSEGLPREFDSNEKADYYFGFDAWQKSIGVRSFIIPAFPDEIVEKNERYIIKYDDRRVKCKVFTSGADTIPHYLDFPIKDRETYLPYKERLLPQLHERIPATIAQIGAQVKNRNYVLSVFGGSTAGWIRDIMGFEGICLGLCLQPELIDEILGDFSNLFSAIAAEIAKHVSIDLVVWWEDIAFKTGPIVPPDFFYEKCGAVYKRVMDIYRSAGTKHAFVDCDGDNRLLVPTWVDHGVDIIFPLEVNAGIHPLTLRSQYPAIRMMGGFDKAVLLRGKDEIRKEFKRLKPLIDEGGFIPHVDHRVQPDVALSDYLYYLEIKRDLLGIPNMIRQ